MPIRKLFAAILALAAAPALAGELPVAEVTSEGICPGRSPLTKIGQLFGCHCEAGAAEASGTVWGSGPYTGDSALCKAAAHAGAVGAAGGPIYVQLAPGADSYTGTEANGVSSADYGSFPNSLVFVSLPSAGGWDQTGACPPSAVALRDSGENLTCHCAGGLEPGTIWGSGVYTDDSAICTAALHAGAIGTEGGTVTVIPGPAQTSFTGSVANGITSEAFGPWDGTFTFAQ